MEIQEKVKGMKDDEDSAANLDILKFVIRQSVEDAQELTDDDFDQLPLDELSRLSSEIMKYSGISDPGN